MRGKLKFRYYAGFLGCVIFSFSSLFATFFAALYLPTRFKEVMSTTNLGGEGHSVVIPLRYFGEKSWPVVEVRVGSRTHRLLLDTGGSTLMLAERVSLDPCDEMHKNIKVRFPALNYSTKAYESRADIYFGSKKSKLDRVLVASLKDMPPNLRGLFSHLSGILGMDAIAGERVVLSAEAIYLTHSTPDIPQNAAPIEIDKQSRAWFWVRVCQRDRVLRVRALLDTGIGRDFPAVVISSELLKSLDEACFILEAANVKMTVCEYGSTTNKMPKEIYLGSAILNSYSVVVDFERKRLWFVGRDSVRK